MANPLVTFQGGPCAGTSRRLTNRELAAGEATCKGTVYVRNPGDTGGEVYYFVPKSSLPKRGATDRQVVGAWTRLVRVLAVNAPRDLRRTSAAAARLRKGVR